jgi:hypothetical protein
VAFKTLVGYISVLVIGAFAGLTQSALNRKK